MSPSHITRLAATFITAFTLAACGAARGTARSTPGLEGATLSDAAAIAKARADSARYPYTTADVQFMSGMIGHHAQALTMSRMAPSHGASPEVLRLAERIINAQQDEIETMQRWLADRQQPVPEARSDGMKMIINGVEHVHLMPGMLSAEQLKQLDQARGPEFDRLFLSFMIQHHRGAVSMVKDLFDTYGAGQDLTVFKFASDVSVDQVTEIERMQKMLAALTLGINLP